MKTTRTADTAGVHLVGAMLFPTADDTMLSVAEELNGAAEWVPDGETGQRMMWITQHQSRFAATAGLEVKPHTDPDTKLVSDRTFYGLADGTDPGDVDLPTLGYAQCAIESFDRFAALQRDGIIAADARFMQAIPTPLALVASFVRPEEHQLLEPVIERAIQNDVAAMCAAIPHEQLAIQWDVAVEFGILEGVLPQTHTFSDPIESVLDRLVRAGADVPPDVHMAYHLCYGAPYDIHLVEPKDATLLTRIANGVLDRSSRPVQRLHMPVPLERDDRAFFAPMADLILGDVKLFLGLVHHEDGVEGGRRRIAAAKQYVPEFGVATECGSARTPTDPVKLLRLQRELGRIATGPPDEGINVPAVQHAAPPDPAQANAQARAIAERISCPICAAAGGVPCSGPNGAALPRPHYARYTGALVETIMPPSRAEAR